VTSDFKDKSIDIRKSEDLLNLLEHVGWTEVLRPQIEAALDRYKRLLPKLVLNTGLAQKIGITKEEVAGRIVAFEFLIETIETVLKKGAKAFQELNELEVPTPPLK